MGSLTPSYIQLAPAPLTSIALIDFNTKQKICFIVDDHQAINEIEEEGKVIIPCYSERDLINKFLQKWKELDPTIVVGWNCIPKTESIWLNNKIINIGDVNEGQKLCLNKGFIQTKYPISNKKVYDIHLSNGKILKSSKEHIFPYYYKDKIKYKNPNSLLKNHGEGSISDIQNLLFEKNIYLKQEKNINNNKPLTFNGLRKELGIEVDVKDEIISNDDLKLLGLLFTDGTFDKNNNGCRIYSSDFNLIQNYIPIINKFRKYNNIVYENLNGSENHLSTKPNYSLNFNTNNKLKILTTLISKNETKKINKTLVSLLSYDQFKALYSGMVDGDGSVHGDNILSLCNYNNDTSTINELLLWNGIYSTITTKECNINIPYSNLNNKNFIDNLDISHSNRIKGINNLKYRKRKNRISNNFKRFEYKGYDLIRINKIVETEEIVEMCDIKSSTNYFNYNGIKTHNCDYFDIPYLFCRIINVFGLETANLLSPLKKVINMPSKPDKPITIAGVASLDYMLLCKKYFQKEEPSYALGVIGEKYAGMGKIDYDGNLDDLFKLDPHKYIEYNIRDVEIIEVLEDKLQFLKLTILISHLCHTPYEMIYYNTVLNEGAILTYLKRKGIVSHNKPTTINPSIKQLTLGDEVVHQRGTPTVEGEIINIRNGLVEVKTKSGEVRVREEKTVRKKQSYAGGFLLEPKPGVYRWLSDYDYASLYPSIIRSLNLGIETLFGRLVIPNATRNLWWGLSDLKQKDPNQKIGIEILDISTYEFKENKTTIGKLIDFIEKKNMNISANGVIFRTDKTSIVAEVLGDWFDLRVEYKGKMKQAFKSGDEDLGDLYNSQQHSLKILLNAVYGGFAINSWRFTDGFKVLSSAITTTGQRMIIETIGYANKVIEEDYLGNKFDGYKNINLK